MIVKLTWFYSTVFNGEGTRVDLEASEAPMGTDLATTTPTTDENHKQSSDTDVGQEAGQSESDAEAEAGMIDGETDAEVDLDAVGWDMQDRLSGLAQHG